MSEEKSLKEKVDDLEKVVNKEKEQEKKKWKLPFSGRVSKHKVKKGYLSVIYLRDNKEIEFSKAPLDDSTLSMDGIPRVITPEMVYTWKRRPVVIVPECSVEGLNLSELREKTESKGMSSVGYRLLLNKIERGAVEQKKKVSPLMIIIGIIALIAIGWYAFKGGV